MADLYSTLGVSKSSSAADIKKAYYKVARECHPDTCKGDPKKTAKFKEASAAYEILSDADKRKQYDAGAIDEQGKPKFTGNPFGGSAGAGGGNPFGGGRTHYSTGGAEGFSEFDLNDIFSMFSGGGGGASPFGGMGGRRAPQRGQDVSYELNIPFVLAATGGETSVRLSSGKQIKVKIPAGAKDGTSLRLREQGLEGPGGAGDAIIKLSIQSHPIFTREGDDVVMTVPITLKEAVQGAKVAIPTLTGRVAMTVPPNTSSGKILRLKGKGIAGKGDLLAKVQIVLPDQPDDALRKFMNSWQPKSQNPRPGF